MLNVKLYGYKKEDAYLLRDKVDECMRQAGLSGKGVTTYCSSEVRVCGGGGRVMPYLELQSSNLDYFLPILNKFRLLGVFENVQVMGMGVYEFLSADDMKNSYFIELSEQIVISERVFSRH